MNKKPDTSRRKPLYSILAIALICIVGGAVAWTATSSPVFGLNNIVTPTRLQPYAFVKIAKPDVMQAASPTSSLSSIIIPTAIIVPTASPVDLPTSSPAPLILPTEISIASATSTPSPITLPTDSQTPIVSQTAEPMVRAEIVADTPPAPGYSSTTQYDVPPSYSGNKYILVDISEQHMYVYEGDTLVYSFVSSTGMHNATRVGSFSVLDKIPNAYGATWDIWMPNWLGIYYAGSMENGIHALPILPSGATLWSGYLGVPISYGCVVLGTYEAQLLYDWADIGTPVEIRW
jgi:lipoprotein-anchoring transpeptidase ErfK/SrfK